MIGGEMLLESVAMATAISAAVVAGIFFAFSTFVMRALRNLPAPQGIRAMQQINITVLNPWFFSVFFGTAAGAMIVLGASILDPTLPDAAGLATGSLAYLAGCILVTVFFNVPMNKALENKGPETEEGAVFWQRYLSRWTAWNHVRTGMSAVAAVCIFAAIN